MSETRSEIFIIDDDADIRTSLARSLVRRGFEVQSFISAQAFLDAIGPDQSGCVILDYGMPGMNGLELQKKLNRDGFTMPIIFITGHGGVPESVEAIKAGAIDFLEKPFRTDVLIERIRAALKIDATASDQREKSRHARERLSLLTAREMEIVQMIVADPSNTTSKQIARALEISPRTVDHHRARILEKMQINSMVELIDLAISAKD